MKQIFLLAFAVTGVASPVLSRPKGKDFGPQLGHAYESLFNDMELVSQGKFGISRIPNDPFNSHGGFRNSFESSSQNDLSKLRTEIQTAGYEHDEGILTNIPAMVREVTLEGKPGKRVKSRTAYWEPFASGAKGLFPNVTRSNPIIPTKLADFEAKVFAAARIHPHRIIVEGYSVFAEPIRFEHKACLSCHQGSRVGDTAAVFVTAIRKSSALKDN